MLGKTIVIKDDYFYFDLYDSKSKWRVISETSLRLLSAYSWILDRVAWSRCFAVSLFAVVGCCVVVTIPDHQTSKEYQILFILLLLAEIILAVSPCRSQ
jgi:hypothetical protein